MNRVVFAGIGDYIFNEFEHDKRSCFSAFNVS